MDSVIFFPFKKKREREKETETKRSIQPYILPELDQFIVSYCLLRHDLRLWTDRHREDIYNGGCALGPRIEGHHSQLFCTYLQSYISSWGGDKVCFLECLDQITGYPKNRRKEILGDEACRQALLLSVSLISISIPCLPLPLSIYIQQQISCSYIISWDLLRGGARFARRSEG